MFSRYFYNAILEDRCDIVKDSRGKPTKYVGIRAAIPHRNDK